MRIESESFQANRSAAHKVIGKAGKLSGFG
jgi:hypothetical protein